MLLQEQKIQLSAPIYMIVPEGNLLRRLLLESHSIIPEKNLKPIQSFIPFFGIKYIGNF